MFRLGKVGTSLFGVILIAVGVCSNDYLAQWGIEEVEHGNGLIFDGVQTLKIALHIFDDMPLLENRLNCTKYRSETAKTRKKRDADFNEGLVVENEVLCRYNEDLSGTAVESRNEEIAWNELLEKPDPLENIYCDDGLSENCILRVLHMPNATFFWKKRYNMKMRKFVLEESAIMHNPPLTIPIVKEISYRTKSMVAQAQNGEDIEISYRCLANPFFGTKEEKPKFGKFIYKLQKERQHYLDAHFAQVHFKVYHKGEAEQIAVQTKARIVVSRTKLDIEVPDSVRGESYIRFHQHANTIENDLKILKRTEHQIETEVRKVDAEPILSPETRPIASMCLKWFETREFLVGNYSAMYEIVGKPKPTVQELGLDYSDDFPVTCANAAFLVLRNNALANIDRARVDESNKQLLTLLNIKFEINRNDRYRIKSRIEKFKDISYLDSVKLALVLSEQRRIQLSGKVKELEQLLSDKTEASRKNEDAVTKVESDISKLMKKMQLDENTRQQTEKNIAAAITNSADLWKKFGEVERRRLALFYGEVRKTKDGHFEIVPNKTTDEKFEKETNKTLELQNDIGKAEKLVEEFKNLVIMQANAIANSKTQLTRLQADVDYFNANYISNVDMAAKIQEQITAKQQAIDAINKDWQDKYDALDREKKSVDGKLKIAEDELNTVKQEKQTAINEKTSLNIQLNTYKNGDLKPNELAQWKGKAEGDIHNLGVKIDATKQTLDEKIKWAEGNWTEGKKQLDTKIANNGKQIENITEQWGALDRQKRSFSTGMRATLEEYCDKVNAEFEKIGNEINKEVGAVSSGLSRAKRGAGAGGILKTAVAQWTGQGILWGALGANTLLDISEWQTRKNADTLLEVKINKSYSEFVDFAAETRSMQSQNSDALKALTNNLFELGAHFTTQTQELKVLVEKLKTMQTFEADTRLWVYFMMDVQTVQRFITDYLQKLMKRTRLMESLERLRSGYIPKDIVTEDLLKSYLRSVSYTLPKGSKLAFSDEKLNQYYQLPLASIVKENDTVKMLVSVPTVEATAKTTL